MISSLLIIAGYALSSWSALAFGYRWGVATERARAARAAVKAFEGSGDGSS